LTSDTSRRTPPPTTLKELNKMMLLTGYKSKKELKENIGAHRPYITGLPGREFFAEITMSDGLISKVK
jgi:hypothetical protein